MDAAQEELGDVDEKKFSIYIKRDSLEKEKDIIVGFKPEVAWVTRTGERDLLTTFSLRPTSETIIYPYFKNNIRTHRDLSMKVNQWVKVARWEVSDPIPLIRAREFEWQNGDSTFTTKEESYDELLELFSIYSRVYENLLVVPGIKGVMSRKEKFSYADYTTSVEVFVPTNGRGVQAATSQCLEKKLWQNSWGLGTWSIGAMAMTRGDDKALMILLKLACYQTVVIPISFIGADTKRIFGACKAILKGAGVCAIVDERDNYACGWKYADWEMKCVLLRIKIGPSEVENVVRAASLSKIIEYVLLSGSTTGQKFDIEEVLKTLKIHEKYRDVVRSVHLDDEIHGNKKRKRNMCHSQNQEPRALFSCVALFSCEAEFIVSTKTCGRIKFKGTSDLTRVYEVCEDEFKLKGENVGISLK